MSVEADGSDPDPDEDILDLLRLTMVPGVGPKTCRTLLERFGSARKVLDAPESSLRDMPGVGPKLAEKVARARRDVDTPGPSWTSAD